MLAALLSHAWRFSGQAAALRFSAALEHPARIQERLLARLVRRASSSAFGKAHDFAAISSPEAFRARVPVQTWGTLSPWVDRIRHGDHDVLTCDRVIRLIPTSGTHARKLIPWTKASGASTGQALAAWLWDLHHSHPGSLTGPAYWSVTPPNETIRAQCPAPVPIGFGSDAEHLGPGLGWLLGSVLAVDAALAQGPDWLDATVAQLRRCRNLRMISVWHPSLLGLILDRLGCADVRQLWPRLAVVSCWSDGPAAAPAAALARRLGAVPIQGKGLIATEGIFSIPWRGRHPAAVDSVVIELRDAHGHLHWLHEARVGRAYEPVVSTAGGLWRYGLGDRVQIDALVGRTPSMRFLGRNGTVHDLAGEKLDEALVGMVMRKAGVCAGFAALIPEPETTPARWSLLCDRHATIDIEQVEAALQDIEHYRIARHLGQLAPLVLRRSQHDAGTLLRAVARKSGLRLGDSKPPVLLAEMPTPDMLTS